MKEIKIRIKDNMDIALLLSGINIMRRAQLIETKNYLSLPDEFKKDNIFKELVDDFDRLNSIAAELSALLEEK